MRGSYVTVNTLVLEFDLVEERISVRLARRQDVLEHLSNGCSVVDDPLTILDLLPSVVDVGHLRHSSFPVEVEVIDPTSSFCILPKMSMGQVFSSHLSIELAILVGLNPLPVR